MPDWIERLGWNAQGLLPVIVQAADSNKVLMHAWMDREALLQTRATGKAVFWSRSRQKLWTKGEDSKHYQHVESIRTDCDNDALLIRVAQEGGITCHTGRERCFFLELVDDKWETVEPVLKDPGIIYK